MNTLPPVTCRVCGTENRPTRLFCSNCGSYLQAQGEDTWEELPPRNAVTPVDAQPPPLFDQPAIADSRQSSIWNEGREPNPTRKPPKGGRNHIVGVALLLLLLAVAGALGALVYATLFSGGGANGDGGVNTSATSGTPTTSATSSPTTSGAGVDTTTSEVSATTGTRGQSISPAYVDASSVLPPENGLTYEPENLFDGSLETAWQEGADGGGEGEWVRFDFDGTLTLSAVEIANGYQKDEARFFGNPRIETLQLEYSDGTAQQVRLYDDTGFQEITPAAKPTEWIRLTILSVYPGDTWDDAGFSEVHLYGAAQ